MRARAAITVWQPRAQVYARWRELAGDAEGPLRLGPIEILEEDPGRRVAWRSDSAGAGAATGVLVFGDAPGGEGTELHLELEQRVRGGPLGAAVTKLAGAEPLQAARDDLRRFKQLVETGEVVVSQGTPEGHSASRHVGQRPAQPLGNATS